MSDPLSEKEAIDLIQFRAREALETSWRVSTAGKGAYTVAPLVEALNDILEVVRAARWMQGSGA